MAAPFRLEGVVFYYSTCSVWVMISSWVSVDSALKNAE